MIQSGAIRTCTNLHSFACPPRLLRYVWESECQLFANTGQLLAQITHLRVVARAVSRSDNLTLKFASLTHLSYDENAKEVSSVLLG